MEVFFYLLVISIPFFNYELFTLDKLVAGAGTVPIHLSHVVSVILVWVFCLHTLLNGGRLKIDKIGKALLFLTGIYFVAVIAVFRVYHNFAEYFKSLAYMLLFTMLYFAFINLIRHQGVLVKIIRIWIVTSLIVCLYGLYQFFADTVSFLPTLPRTELKVYQGFPRIYSLMREPVEFVAYLLYPMILMFIFVVEKQPFPFRTPARNIFALLLMLTTFVLSFSLTGYACFCFFLLFFCLDRFSHADIKKLRLPVLVVLMIMLGSFFSETHRRLQERIVAISNLSEGSTLERLNSISIACQEFMAHPLLGIGPGNFQSHSASGMFLSKQYGHVVTYADSAFFNNLAELGIIGMAAIFLLFAVLFKSLRKVIRFNKINGLNLQISRGLYFVFLVYLAVFIPAGAWFHFGTWLAISIIGAWTLLERKRISETQSYY